MKFRNLKTVFVLCVFPLIQQLEDVTKQEQTQPEKAKRKESVCLTVKKFTLKGSGSLLWTRIDIAAVYNLH